MRARAKRNWIQLYLRFVSLVNRIYPVFPSRAEKSYGSRIDSGQFYSFEFIADLFFLKQKRERERGEVAKPPSRNFRKHSARLSRHSVRRGDDSGIEAGIARKSAIRATISPSPRSALFRALFPRLGLTKARSEDSANGLDCIPFALGFRCFFCQSQDGRLDSRKGARFHPPSR